MSARPYSRRVVATVIATASLLGGSIVWAAALDAPATVTAPAERSVQPMGDLAVVFDVGDVDRAVVEASDRVARRIGGTASVGRSGSLGMRAITRDGATVHAPPGGYLIPMVYISMPRGSIGRVMGADVTAVLGPDEVVMNEVTAELTGAEVGDVVVMQSADGSAVPLTIGGIRPYDQVGWAELVFAYDVADQLGATNDTRAVIYGFDDRAAFDAAVEAEGLVGRQDTKVNRSWDPQDPDDTLSTARTKVALGEPWYRFTADGSVTMHPTWKAENLTDGRVLLDESIPIRAQCHVEVVDDLHAALAEVAAAGLGGAIDVANANSAGGCYVPRFSRVSGQIGFLSRHTYGMAFDTNTTPNCAGCRPQMHCDVVRIFRRHGFAWGGNFRRPDGMHFEWVGEPRDQIDFPSTYCPNVVTGAALTASGPGSVAMGRGVLIAGSTDGVGDEGMSHDHAASP
ncbi:MAG: M15 family metallopeptidase [Ilumatobacteraceae bacterium]|nr:M15 family metallopeptidase [Ilumatobacteraceae bacterium]